MITRVIASFAGILSLIAYGCGGADEGTGAGPGSTVASSGAGGHGGQGTGGQGTGGQGGEGGAVDRPPPSQDWTRDIVSTDLELDMTALSGKATIVLAPSMSKGASFEVGDLEISAVSDAVGPLMFSTATPKELDVGVPASPAAPVTIVVVYDFKQHEMFDGWMKNEGVTFLWPYFCGNLFPCKSDPSDGVKFTMKVTGTPAMQTAVYPTSIPGDAPSYMPAVAIGAYTKLDLGTTAAGTKVSAWYLPGGAADAMTGTQHLQAVFDFYEKTYGKYSFGGEVGSVAAAWGPGAYGGMEHHPFWHVATDAMSDEYTSAHEAAHGWFGDGVRIACWEDFVLSEGTVSYLAMHALEKQGVDVWTDAACWVKDDCAMGNTIAYPDTCDKIDILTDPLWSDVPYSKGAFFYKEVAAQIGEDVLDGALSTFYKTNVGSAKHEQDLIDFIKSKVSVADAMAIDALETAWLKTLACPAEVATFCP